MEKMSFLKLEKNTIPGEKIPEFSAKLFKPIGQETFKKGGRLEIENENLEISLRYKNVDLETEDVPKNEEEMIGKNLNFDQRRLLKFLDFKPDDYYEMVYFYMKDKNNLSNIELEGHDAHRERIFVKKNSTGISGSKANFLYRFIKLEAEPKTAAAILTLFHET